MCGINGFNWKDEMLIRKMDEVTKHRGPDASNIFLDEGMTLGHNRLSIIDLNPTAGQPMKSEDGQYVIVYNGEIYNYLDLKAEFEPDHIWKTHGDTEVILAAYKKWGKDCVKKFNGIFAFAIWDTVNKELFLARDHNGIKPLYYHLTDGPSPRFVFSSEIKAILEHPIPRKLRQHSLSDYLRVLFVPEPYTMLEGIMKLPAAYYAIFKDGRLSLTRYWESRKDQQLFPKKEFEHRLRENMAASVKRQLVSDRPLGVFLSGGLDSTVILHHVSQLRNNIDTYSVGFDLSKNEQEEKFNQDFNLARATAAHYKTNHHEVLVTVDDVVDNLENAIWHLDEPIANLTIIAQFILSRFAKQTVDVVLGGDGGDELFGGYDRYRYSLLESYYQRLPVLIRRIANHIGKLKKLDVPTGIDRYAQFLFQKDKAIREVSPKYLDQHTRSFFHKKFFPNNEVERRSFEEIFMETDRRSWLTDESLVRTDKMTMSAGIESRVPFLDTEMIGFAGQVPLKYKTNIFRTKILVRDAYKGLIPDFIYNQPKRGWFSPGAKWLRNEKIAKYVRDILSETYCPATSKMFEWSGVGKMLDDHISGARYNATMLWALVIFQIWAKKYKITV